MWLRQSFAKESSIFTYSMPMFHLYTQCKQKLIKNVAHSVFNNYNPLAISRKAEKVRLILWIKFGSNFGDIADQKNWEQTFCQTRRLH